MNSNKDLDDVWPKGEMAPCRSDGGVYTVDYDTKAAACFCPIRSCLVDFNNKILSLGIGIDGTTGKGAYSETPYRIKEQLVARSGTAIGILEQFPNNTVTPKSSPPFWHVSWNDSKNGEQDP